MTIGKPGKIAIVIASVLPFFYMLFFMGYIFFTMFSSFYSKTPPTKEAFDFMPVLFLMHFAVMLLMFALLAFYLIYLYRSERIPQDKKVLWAILIFMGSFIAMPIFWYLYIWREPANAPTGG